ncbi:MAG: hypothetical protein EPGJADBJ_00638 [Saprospiraceae bacterium]|nr:hypothetical protein [Saprospiraceae bacterium]
MNINLEIGYEQLPMFPHLLSVQPTAQYKLQLRYDDGTEGVADVSHLAGRGVFRQWDEDDLFFQVKIDPETNALVWNDMLDLDPDSLYLQIKGLTFEQFKASRKQPAHAAD